MKTLIAAAVFGVISVSCYKDRVQCVEEPCNGLVPCYCKPVCRCNDSTFINWEEADFMEFMNIVKELVMNKQYL